MAYVIGQPCIGVKDTACVDACPVDSIHSLEGAPQYYIEPATCIDCSACEPVCPVKAIWAGDQVPADQKKFIAVNIDFFKTFDKAKSTTYTRQKKSETKEEGGATASPAAGAAPAAPVDVVLKEVEGWEPRWEAHKNEVEDSGDVQKRYGRVRAIFEQNDQFIVRIFLPERAPNHPFRFKYGLPEEMSTYVVSAVLHGNSVSVYGKIADPRFAKICGHANSFPDRFHFDYPFPKRVGSVSVRPQGTHVVDVIGIKSAEPAKAA